MARLRPNEICSHVARSVSAFRPVALRTRTRFSSPCLSRWGRLGRLPSFLHSENAAAPRLACNCRTPSEFAAPSLMHAFNSGGRPDKCRHSFFSGLVGNKGAFAALQEEGQQAALFSDVMSPTSVTVWPCLVMCGPHQYELAMVLYV
jgi:hypothetical protein